MQARRRFVSLVSLSLSKKVDLESPPVPNLTEVSVVVWSSKGVRLVPAAGGNQTAFVDFTTEVGIPNGTFCENVLNSIAGRRASRASCEQPTSQRPTIGRHSRLCQRQKQVAYFQRLWTTMSDLPCFIQCAYLSPRRGCSLLACQEPSKRYSEPLLQQVFDKPAPVKRVEIFVDSGEAVVELVNPSVR